MDTFTLKKSMSTKNSDQSSHASLGEWHWTNRSLSAESIGKPIKEIEMDCHICTIDEGKMTAAIPVKAIWDTGSSVTVISSFVAASLGLQIVGEMRMHGMGGTEVAPICYAYLRFPNGTAIGPVRMAIHNLPSTEVLIGMNIITAGKFLLERKPDGGTRFSFTL